MNEGYRKDVAARDVHDILETKRKANHGKHFSIIYTCGRDTFPPTAGGLNYRPSAVALLPHITLDAPRGKVRKEVKP